MQLAVQQQLLLLRSVVVEETAACMSYWWLVECRAQNVDGRTTPTASTAMPNDKYPGVAPALAF
jgi:hypothetical protein